MFWSFKRCKYYIRFYNKLATYLVCELLEKDIPNVVVYIYIYTVHISSHIMHISLPTKAASCFDSSIFLTSVFLSDKNICYLRVALNFMLLVSRTTLTRVTECVWTMLEGFASPRYALSMTEVELSIKRLMKSGNESHFVINNSSKWTIVIVDVRTYLNSQCTLHVIIFCLIICSSLLCILRYSIRLFHWIKVLKYLLTDKYHKIFLHKIVSNSLKSLVIWPQCPMKNCGRSEPCERSCNI